jgi:hypothetical protein
MVEMMTALPLSSRRNHVDTTTHMHTTSRFPAQPIQTTERYNRSDRMQEPHVAYQFTEVASH